MKEGGASPESIAVFGGMASQLKGALVELYNNHPDSIVLSGILIMYLFAWLGRSVSDFGFISYDQELMFEKSCFCR